MLRRALLATLLASAITPVLSAKEKILLHRVGPSESTLFITKADGSDVSIRMTGPTCCSIWADNVDRVSISTKVGMTVSSLKLIEFPCVNACTTPWLHGHLDSV